PFDIIRSSLFLGNLTAEVFDGNPVLYDNHNFNDAKGHEYVSGAYLNYKDKACVISDIELLYLGDTDNDNLIKGEDNGWGKLNQHTIDLLLKGPLFSSGISYDAEYAYQFGKYATNEIKDAYALHADLRREFNLPLKPELKIEYNNASGDKDPGDGKTNTFIPAYQTTHAPYGIMDFFRWQNMREAAASIKLNPGKNISLTPGVNCFWLDEKRDSWYKSDGTKVRTATTGDISSYVGTEASLVANYKINKYISFESGYAHFFTGNYVKDTGPSNDADFAYAQTKICF
ncbi:MAG: alginate export family protein, partial [Candidatus Omnitrophica bacterium]|nr:alginate export family protein [Candidatus Omnitrophota bacterium]